MAEVNAETLKNILLSSNSIALSLHENGHTLKNHVKFAPAIESHIFLHGRDMLEKNAKFASNGRLIIEKNGKGLRTGHPFNDADSTLKCNRIAGSWL